eukprot:TRINITY_DN7923_c0_g4_i1.p1 TRINITY_DN7923_c0_g4~~TRINITY_DN7923_c0_g4_i1.p1  ORF type:complete len:547 (-),score=178.46 TRINITY_DN7923_c0_g4_i1:16-1656(-)
MDPLYASKNTHQQLLEELSEEVKCVICLELFEDPRLLQCSHTFCYECISQIVRGGQIACPICREVHKLDRKGITGLSKNRYIANIVEKLKKTEDVAQSYASPLIQNASELHQSTAPLPFPYNLYVSQVPPAVPNVNPSYSQSDPNLDHFGAHLPRHSVHSNNEIISNNNNYNPENPLESSNYPQLHVNNDMFGSVPSAPPMDDNPQKMEVDDEPVYRQQPVNYPNVPGSYPDLSSSQSNPQNQPAPSSSADSKSNSGIFNSILSFFSPSATKGEEDDKSKEGPFFAPFVTRSNNLLPIFSSWTRGLWFAPTNFLNDLRIVREEARYVPFWIYDVSLESKYHATIQFFEPDSRKKITKENRIYGSKNGNYYGILVCSDVDLADPLVELVKTFEDWQTTKAKLRAPDSCIDNGFLSSLLGSDSDPLASKMVPKMGRTLSSDQGFQKTFGTLQARVETECRDKILTETPAETIVDFHQNLSFLGITKSLVYLPAYFLTYTFEGSEYNCVINAQTGSIRGDRPWGLGKIGSLGRSGFDYLESIFTGRKKT